jgi:hypothetical protein
MYLHSVQPLILVKNTTTEENNLMRTNTSVHLVQHCYGSQGETGKTE